ncbi:MAG: helix-turn-helix domain-containing protein [Candidatus Pelagadaptatus aseana]|uniref:helix-turn-helix domain-containing protein n=1 Tax=Candidatus Pelagadaptatus aseana TaxID=3120508 RepID=UPI0039B27506
MTASANNELVLAAALAFALSQILLSLLLLLRRCCNWSVQEKLYVAFLLAVSGYLLTPLATTPGWRMVLSTVQTFVPGLFWLFSASLFDDHFRLRAWKIGLVAITVFLPFVGSLIRIQGGFSNQLVFFTLPQTLEFVLMSLALVAVVRTWRADLVQSRRTLRFWFCGLGGVYIMTLLLVREVLFSGADWLPVWQYVPLGLVVLVTNAILLDYKTETFLPKVTGADGLKPAVESSRVSHGESSAESNGTAVSNKQAETDDAVRAEEEVPPEILDNLNGLMEGDHIYREMGLTIGQLASRMDLPEYRLRKVINAGLGYRNFNDFLNTYRIREARERLANPDEVDTPVLNIALDAGYRSLSSFNKAFKETLEQTPTEFRNSMVSS